MRSTSATLRTILALAWVGAVYSAYYFQFFTNIAASQPMVQGLLRQLGLVRGG